MTNLYFYLRGLTLREERGQTMAEYAVVLALVVAIALAAFGLLGGQIQDKIADIGGLISGAGTES
jgi:Flp pilus assembly pilin Flp